MKRGASDNIMVSSRHPESRYPVLPSPQVRCVLFHRSARLRPQGFIRDPIPTSPSRGYIPTSWLPRSGFLALLTRFSRDTFELFSKDANKMLSRWWCDKRKISKSRECDNQIRNFIDIYMSIHISIVWDAMYHLQRTSDIESIQNFAFYYRF